MLLLVDEANCRNIAVTLIERVKTCNSLISKVIAAGT
jgi:hypothetical protein